MCASVSPRVGGISDLGEGDYKSPKWSSSSTADTDRAEAASARRGSQEVIATGGLHPGPKRVHLTLQQTQYSSGEYSLSVHFSRPAENDPDSDLRAWDFMVLHKEGNRCDEYDASRYLHSPDEGNVLFETPYEPGRYVLSVVRDIKYTWRVLGAKRDRLPKGSEDRAALRVRIKEYQQMVQIDQEEHFVVLDSVAFEVPPPPVKKEARVRVVGSTGLTEGIQPCGVREKKHSIPSLVGMKQIRSDSYYTDGSWEAETNGEPVSELSGWGSYDEGD